MYRCTLWCYWLFELVTFFFFNSIGQWNFSYANTSFQQRNKRSVYEDASGLEEMGSEEGALKMML